MKKYLLMSALVLPALAFSQWSKVSNTTSRNARTEFKNFKDLQLFSLDSNALKSKLANAPQRFSGQNGVEVLMPNDKGELEKFRVWEYSNFTPELQAKFPDIKSYMGVGVTDPSAYVRFSVSNIGLSATTLKNGGSNFIEAYVDNGNVYAAYKSSSRLMTDQEAFVCSTMDGLAHEVAEVTSSGKASNKVLKTFRLAMSAQAEYSQFHIERAGATNATDAEKKAVVLAAINNTVTRVNALYEKDLAVHFNLVDNLNIIYLDPATDPYTTSYNSQLQNTLNTEVKAANYDIGHVLVYASPNGNAGCIGCICVDSSKGSAFTAHYIPVGDSFDIDYVAHEMGHQVGANHTHTYSGSESSGVQVELGSGNTIMGYTGITGATDTQFNSNDFFTYRNILQIQNNLANKACAVNTPLTNNPPVVSAGGNYTIPISTPFVLKGEATDAEGDAMTYVWEQNNSASASNQFGNPGSFASPTKAGGPNFKMFPPSTSLVRYLPEFGKTLAGVTATRWEALSSVARTLDFTFTARDNSPNGSQTNTAAMKITVSAAAGPFVVTAPTFGESLAPNSSYTVKWNVASTNAAPVNTSNVNIKLSTDGGKTFSMLLANTPNDGEQSVTIPAVSSANAYIMIEPVDNIYFAVSSSFVVDYSVLGEACKTYSYTGPAVDINDGTGTTTGPISSPKIEVPINVTDSGVITKISVKPTIEHPRVSQLAVGIEGPLGTSSWLWNRRCTNSGLQATFSDDGVTAACASPVVGTVKPDESLNIFRGNDSKGTWKLFASDNVRLLTGKVTTWDLEICTRDSKALAVNEAVTNSNNIKVYPNPNNGQFFIKSKDLGGDARVMIYDMAGKLVYSSGFNLVKGESTNEFSTKLPTGSYLIKVASPNGNYTQKLLIK